MDDTPKTCPKCGTDFQGFDLQDCPVCSLGLGLTSEEPDTTVLTTDYSAAASAPSDSDQSPASAGGGIKDGPPSRTRLLFDFSSRPLRWGLTLLFVAVTLYFGERLTSSFNNLQCWVILEPSLRVVFDHEEYGLLPGHRLERIGSQPITSRLEALDVIESSEQNRLRLFFSPPPDIPSAGPVEMLWTTFPRPLHFEIERETGFRGGPPKYFPQDLLDPGDRVVGVNGLSLEEIVAKGLRDSDLRRDRTRFSVINTGDPPRQYEILVQQMAWITYWSRYVVGAILGLLGLVAIWLRPNTRSSRAFLLFCMWLALLWFTRALPFPYRNAYEDAAYLVLQCGVLIPSALFLITFTPVRAVRISLRSCIVGSLLVVSAILIGSLTVDPVLARYGLLTTGFQKTWASLMLLLLLVGVTSVYWVKFLGVKLGSGDRERTRTIIIAMLLGFGPIIFYSWFYFSELSTPVDVATELSVLLFPTLLLYAIVRQNLLRTNELLLEGFIIACLLGVFLTAYGVIGALLVPLLLEFVPEKSSPWTQAASFAAIVVIGVPLQASLRNALAARFNRVPREYSSLVESVSRLTHTRMRPQEILRQIVVDITTTTRASNVTLCTNSRDHGGWAIAATTPLAVTGLTTDRCSALFHLVETDKSPVFRDDVYEDLRYKTERDDYLDGLNALQANVVLPITAYGRVMGALALGNKASHSNFSAAELNSLRQVADQLGRCIADSEGPVARQERRIAELFPRYPERIGQYQIKGIIGEGGMSYVYRGVADEQTVAIKVANMMVQSSSDLVERFHREASANQRLKTPYIVEVFEVGWQGSEPYIVMEYFPEGCLSDSLRKVGPLDVDAAINAIVCSARGLSRALEAGIVHRDVKPRNLFRGTDGNVRVGDFGLALLTDRTTITRVGEMMGTPGYVSPEMIDGEKATWRSDQYALGITFYELLAGEKPFRGEDFQSVLYQQLNKNTPDVRKIRGDVPRKVTTIISRMTAKEPDHRYDSYERLIDELLDVSKK